MFCIAAFIVLAIISIFSVSKRQLAKKAWSCTWRRITLRPCDTSFKEEAKSKILSKVAKGGPKVVKAADIGLEIASFALVFLTIWSLLTALNAGLNLFVWGTCNPNQASSCSLGSETCSIDKAETSFGDRLKQGQPWMWFVDKAAEVGNTLANIPTRLKSWDATQYLPDNVSYYYEYNSSKPTALDIIDPGCSVCAQSYKNLKAAGFRERYNLTYIAYPIKDPYVKNQYKFKNSYVVAQYLEAIKLNPLENQKVPADWQILDKIFTSKDSDGLAYQTKINNRLDQQQAAELIQDWLIEIGYKDTQLEKIIKDSSSQEVKNSINQAYQIVEQEVKTVKIPTIIFNNRRHDGLVNQSLLD